MCRLTIKIRIFGKKNQEFVRFILVPQRLKQRSKYISTLGYWDTRQNRQTRYIVLNIYKIMYHYFYGAKATRRALDHIYKYFVDVHNFNNWVYYTYLDFFLMVEDEIKKKYS